MHVHTTPQQESPLCTSKRWQACKGVCGALFKPKRSVHPIIRGVTGALSRAQPHSITHADEKELPHAAENAVRSKG
jgi:hypothetical protein